MKEISGIIIILILLLGGVSCGKSEPEPPSIPDTIAPSIANVSAENITEITATVAWATDEPATSQVEFDETTHYGSSTPLDEDLLIDHSVSLSGLEPGTTYHYRVRSQDSSNNEAVSDDYTFTTASSVTGQLTVHFINVGQGDAILVDYGTHEMLIDGGRWGDCAAYIPSYIDGALEVMVATHPHADHIGGLIGVLNTFEVDEIWLNGDTSTSQTYSQFMSAVDSEGAQVYEARRGDTIQVGDIVFDVLHPDNLGGTTNNNSIVLSLSYGEIDFLFMGDAEQEAESSMLRAGIVFDVEILKVGHHGSRTASSSQFLQVAKPECAIYMAGKGNSYGHPHQETIDALAEVHALTCGTDQYGTIIVTTDGSIFTVEPPCSTPPKAPPIIEVINLSISPDEVEPGETVTISATIKNSGGSQGSYEATLTVNGTEVETKSIVLNTGESEIVEFTLSYQSTGTYMVEVNGSEGTFTVVEQEIKGTLDVSASVKFPTLGGGTQTLYATVTLDGQPVQGADVSITVYYKTVTRYFSGPLTGPDGETQIMWSVGRPRGGYTVRIEVVATYKGQTAKTTTGFYAP